MAATTPRKRKSTKAETPATNTQYLVSDDKGQFVIEIPSEWKVTFGWVNPGATHGGGTGYKEGHCLRIWEGTKLRAVFNNVFKFRDMGIPLARRVESETGSHSWNKDSAGNFKSETEVQKDSTLVLEAPSTDVFGE